MEEKMELEEQSNAVKEEKDSNVQQEEVVHDVKMEDEQQKS
jgi:hypothetical protein